MEMPPEGMKRGASADMPAAFLRASLGLKDFCEDDSDLVELFVLLLLLLTMCSVVMITFYDY